MKVSNIKEAITNNPKFVKGIFVAVSAYLNLLAVNKLSFIVNLSSEYDGASWFGYNALQILIYAADCFLLWYFVGKTDSRQKVFASIPGIVMSFLIVSGTYLHFVNDLFNTFGNFVTVILITLGVSLFVIPLWAFALEQTRKIGDDLKERTESDNQNDSKGNIGYFFIMWGVVTLFFLPVLLTWWPGNFIYDAADQMREYLAGTLSTHHPLIHTLLMAGCYRIGGKFLGNASFGFGIYTTIQMLVITAAYAYLLWMLKKKNVSRIIRVLTFLWIVLFPLNKCFAVTATKDVLCGGFFLIFAVSLMRLLFYKEHFKWFDYVILLLAGILSCMFRNNMIYAIVAGGLVILLMQKGTRKKLLVLAIIGVIFIGQKGGNTALKVAFHASSPDSMRESLSVPLQCLARVAVYRRNELPDEQYEEIAMYIPRDMLDSGGYNPYNSDPIKNDANEKLLRSNFVNFLKLWVKVGLKFPGEYTESILTNTLAYWYPDNMGHYALQDFSAYHKLIYNGEEIVKSSPMPQFIIDFYQFLYYENNYYKTPLLGFFFRPAAYFWLMMFGIVYGLYRKNYRQLALFAIPFMYFGTCFMGPIVALRYIYPVITVIPLYFISSDTGVKQADFGGTCDKIFHIG